jgi:hypothetical protein
LAALKDEPTARAKVLRALTGAGLAPQIESETLGIEAEAEPLAIEAAEG